MIAFLILLSVCSLIALLIGMSSAIAIFDETGPQLDSNAWAYLILGGLAGLVIAVFGAIVWAFT